MRRQPTRRDQGIAMLYVAFALVPLAGLLALAMQWAQLTTAQATLQDYVDARAISSIEEHFGARKSNDERKDPVDIQAFFGDQTLQGAPPQCGGWDHAGRNFVANSPCRSSPGVPAHRFEHSITVPILFAPFAKLVGGGSDAQLTASATAFIPRRKVMLVQDISGSLGNLMPSTNALMQVVTTMFNQNLPGDRVGLVTFGAVVQDPQTMQFSGAQLDQALFPLETNPDLSPIGSAIQNLAQGAAGRRNSTCTADGIQLGREEMQAEVPEHEDAPIMIIVTDGVPFCPDPNLPNETPQQISQRSRQEAVLQAGPACGIDQIDVWVIGVPNLWGNPPNLGVINQLACNDENVILLDSVNAVSNAVVDILTRIPVRIVE